MKRWSSIYRRTPTKGGVIVVFFFFLNDSDVHYVRVRDKSQEVEGK